MKIQSNEHPIGLVHRSFATRTTNKRLDKVYLLPANSGPGKKMHGRCQFILASSLNSSPKSDED